MKGEGMNVGELDASMGGDGATNMELLANGGLRENVEESFKKSQLERIEKLLNPRRWRKEHEEELIRGLKGGRRATSFGQTSNGDGNTANSNSKSSILQKATDEAEALVSPFSASDLKELREETLSLGEKMKSRNVILNENRLQYAQSDNELGSKIRDVVSLIDRELRVQEKVENEVLERQNLALEFSPVKVTYDEMEPKEELELAVGTESDMPVVKGLRMGR
jgi:hypothetical protein